MKFSKINKITGYHRGIPYSNSLFAWEDNYNIEFNNNMYYIKLKTHYSFIHSNFQFRLFYKKRRYNCLLYKQIYCTLFIWSYEIN